MTYPSTNNSEVTTTSLITEELRTWATEHYRARTFFREEKIPTRSGLLYFIDGGYVRLESRIQTLPVGASIDLVNTAIDFVGENQAIDVFKSDDLSFEAIAQTDRTTIFWVYWADLDRWQNLKAKVLEHLQYQSHKQIMLRTILGQKRTVDQLRLYLEFLAKMYGEPQETGLKIPFGLTHDNLASVLGTTRVTISRLLNQLKEEQQILFFDDQYFGVPTE
ncbi:putative transcriptional regulator, Crp/Fnr family [[Leptolyngbya] sp. PCC 7376]|uniref:Crp/Fnr family transcriptional regulator n=1 Tax=[Leptolyngbya] sp. PCC 7376 TaxID=111781 RepID=UPI00029F2D4C|nr:Crp/Fnr family transcriptional regulator [[Leptolyngbya] sp. PCC 7376]AFY37974.1 putative transcriptional regulator, Crp/Fnr family [[Leptolyngbya] sp. PCC 7376]